MDRRVRYTRERRWLALTALTVSLITGCAGAGVQRESKSVQVDDSSARSGVEIAHSFHHEIKTADGRQRQFVEHGWDYDRAVAFERISSPNYELIEQRDRPGLILRATDRELELAFELVRAHPELAPIVNVDGAMFEGGFIHMLPDDPLCHLRSRCVYVLVSLDRGRRKVAQALVDLQTGTVAYPNFDPIMIDN